MIETRNGSILSAVITGLANFGVQYNFQNIGLALLIMSEQECTLDSSACEKGKQASWVHSSSSAVVFAGAIIGQLTMGYLGDLIGRSRALLLTIALALLSALFSGIIPYGSAVSIYTTIITFRFFLGIGIGGIFPLSATKSSEDSSHSNSDRVNPIGAAWTYFWQMPGIMGPYIVTLILLEADISTSMRWRLLLGCGSIPLFLSAFGLFIELYNENSISSDRKQFITPGTISSSDLSQAEMSKDNSESDSLMNNQIYRNNMVASGGTWFLFDIVVFGVLLSGNEIIAKISNVSDDISSTEHIRTVAKQQLIATSIAAAGTIAAIFILKRIGLKLLQIGSFIFIAVCSLILACVLIPLQDQAGSLFAVYCLLNLSIQSGVNITSFALPSMLFPKKVRATYNGIAAGLGKLGAAIGAFSFVYIAEVSSFTVVMIISCCISIFAAVISVQYIDSDKVSLSTNERIAVPTSSIHGSLSETTDDNNDDDEEVITFSI